MKQNTTQHLIHFLPKNRLLPSISPPFFPHIQHSFPSPFQTTPHKKFNPITKHNKTSKKQTKMIHLLFFVIFAEAATILLLLFKTPLRKLVVGGLDKIKRGRGPIVVKTVSATILVVLTSSIYSVVKFTRRGDVDDGAPTDLNPTEQVLFAKHLLEASLMGFILFLSLMIDRLHHYIRELRLRRKTMEAGKKSDVKFASPEEVKAREMQVDTFKDMIRQMETELEDKIKEASSSEATVEALRKQSEVLLLEYDRLLAENQELRNRL